MRVKRQKIYAQSKYEFEYSQKKKNAQKRQRHKDYKYLKKKISCTTEKLTVKMVILWQNESIRRRYVFDSNKFLLYSLHHSTEY